jgi:glutamine synthetase
MDGISSQRDPGKRLDINMYTEGHLAGAAPRLPLYLIDALRAFAASDVLRAGLGEAFADAYIKLRTQDWNLYARHLTQWERDTTLDC